MQSEKKSDGRWNSYQFITSGQLTIYYTDFYWKDWSLTISDKASVESTNVEKIFISQYCLLLLKQLDGIHQIISQSTADCRPTEEDETITEKQTSSTLCATTETLVYHISWYENLVQTIMSKTISNRTVYFWWFCSGVCERSKLNTFRKNNKEHQVNQAWGSKCRPLF